MHKMKTAKSLRKPPPISAASQPSRDSDSDVQFELELCWCVQQLETALNAGKLSQKVAEDTSKNLKTLKSSTAPLIKKRQVMKAAFGDYRAKMKDEEKKMALASKQVKFTTAAETNKKSNFVKKSAILTSGKDFRFDFHPQPVAENVEKNDCTAPSTCGDPHNIAITSKGIAQTSREGGVKFKFNFNIDEDCENFHFNGLSINN